MGFDEIGFAPAINRIDVTAARPRLPIGRGSQGFLSARCLGGTGSGAPAGRLGSYGLHCRLPGKMDSLITMESLLCVCNTQHGMFLLTTNN